MADTSSYQVRVNSFVTLKAGIELIRVGDIGQIIGLEAGCASMKFAVGILRDIPVSLLVPPPKVFRGGIGSRVRCKIHHPSIPKGSVGTLVGPSRVNNYREYVEVVFENGSCTMHESQLSLIDSQDNPTVTDELTGLVRELNIDGKKKKTIEEIRASFGKAQTPTYIDTFSKQDKIPTSLRTEDITLISHAHGRQRRGERNIERQELQAAIKHGRKDIANPGRDGSKRWRYEHMGVVYITDETSRHEVTSWRIDGEDEDEEVEEIAPAEVELAGKGCHAVLIVDNSASMRASDVPGYETRAKAVYQCLKNDFAKEQLKSGAADDVVVTLISMSNDASVLIDTKPLDESFIKNIERISKRRPKSHGNYIPALDKALEVMTADAPNRSSVLLLFFSDGAPSDQSCMKCEHGIQIFDIDRKVDPKMQHTSKGSAWNCRKRIMEKLEKDCCNRVKRIGQVFGRDKVIFRTLAFGPIKEDFRLLEQMAGVLPRGEFQKLGLNAANLKTAFSSVSSSLLTLRTEGGHHASLTRRSDKVVDKNQKVDPTLRNLGEKDGWYIYAFDDFLGKFQFPDDDEPQSYKIRATGKKLVKSSLSPGANGFAFYETPYEEGAERFVYRCTEISAPIGYRPPDGSMSNTAQRCGLRLVAKEAKDVENHHQGRKWHEKFARTQLIAATLAKAFTKRLPNPYRREWTVTFIKTTIYGCVDLTYENYQAWVLVEPELDGKFLKWNNNAGLARRSTATVRPTSNDNSNFETVMGTLPGALPAFEEFDEDDEEDSDGEEEEERIPIELDDIPQAFSHFSYEHSAGRQLVCDLQGVWNADDGYLLTDPVVHQVGEQRYINGATDKGLVGIKNFFETHVCSSLCKKMGLPLRTPASNLINYIKPAQKEYKKLDDKKYRSRGNGRRRQ